MGASGASSVTEVMVSVRGEANLEAEPELCEFTILVGAKDKDRITTLERLTQRNSQALDLVKSYGDAVEKVETSGFTVHPEQQKSRRDEKVRTYVGAVRIRVVVKDFTVLGELISRVADDDMRSVDGPFWSLRRDSDVYRRARTLAVSEAVTRAHEYTGALGSRVTGLVELSDTGLSTQGAQPRMMRMAAFGAAADSGYQAGPPPLDLEPVRQTVYASVEARFTASQPSEF
jgi:uncharacterized protein